MALGLSGEEYLEEGGALQGGAAYGTPGNPAQAPTVQGGWGGLLLAGATTIAGLASDNAYLVAGGSAAGQSYHDSYDTLNKSLVEEQRANRLADASLARQKNLKKYDYDLGAEDRQAALAEDKRRYDQDFGLKQSQEARAAEAAKISNQLNQKKIDQLNKTPEELANEQVVAMQILAKAEQKINADNTTAQNAQQLNILASNLEAAGASEDTIQRAKLTLMLQQAGLDTKTTKPKPFSGEQKVKLQQTAKEEYMSRPANQARMETEPEVVEAEADQHGIQTANAIEANLQGGSGVSLVDQIMAGGGAGGDTGEDTGGEGGSDVEKAVRMYHQGKVSAAQLLAGADTEEEKAAVQQAINLRQQEDAAPQSAGALSGRLEAQAAAENQAELQQRYDQADNPLAQQAAVNAAQAQGVDLTLNEASGGFTPNQQRTIDRQVANYQKADTKKRKKIIDNLRKNAPPELLKEVLRRVQ